MTYPTAREITTTTRRLAASDYRRMSDIAAEAKISVSTINMWRTMKRSPSLAGVMAVLNAVGWTLVLRRITPDETVLPLSLNELRATRL